MSKELEKVKSSIMDKIHNKDIRMKPRLYFMLGSLFTFVGLVGSIAISVFLIGLIRFSFRTHGPIGQYRFDTMLSSFPWFTILFSIIFLVAGVLIMRKYDFSHKVKPAHLVIGLVLAVLLAGWFIDLTGINNSLLHHGPMQGMMRGYLRNNLK